MRKGTFRMTKAEAKKLRAFIADARKRLENKRQAAVVGFAMMFGKDLFSYNKICVGGV